MGHAQGAFNAPEPSKDFSLIHTTEERYIERGLLLFCCDRITRGPDSDSKLAVGFIGENTVYRSDIKSKCISRKSGLMLCLKTILNCFALEHSAFKQNI